MLNQDQVLSAIRSLLIALFTFAVGKGWISTDTATNLAALVIPLGLAIWGLTEKTKAATVAKAADIVKIPVEEQAKVGITNPKVVPSNPKQAPGPNY